MELAILGGIGNDEWQRYEVNYLTLDRLLPVLAFQWMLDDYYSEKRFS